MPELPDSVIENATRLTRRARESIDESEADAYREDRDERLAEHDFNARIRNEDARDVLVLHPDEWVSDGKIHPDRIEDTDRAVEIQLDGADHPDDWDAVEEHNAEVVERVREAHGDDHAANVRAFADFMGNYYARPLESATDEEIQEFLDDYYPRNVWPTEAQAAVVEQSLQIAFDVEEKRMPGTDF
ncbi:DUF7108 family protein [Halostella pelagica]|uniref:DUF7108 family protein n=1 Tax=Halostella pelagica TaxID=2583824 RepID=UPI0010807368|nr:rnhA operon protein [Halostella pelagica]